ncbi:hypothetical protein BV22DRAFT_158778 [Leucogyrophana mollusca]|uniref:Uncharacterized protein n=1 Tax=Leucogyrophana mollusca TaxID=85980 RepID=A0ACB8BU91_9AGAM|nr:hypothetical protein BV22DRAFT_158778 [Leucogyrophana mollusca]
MTIHLPSLLSSSCLVRYSATFATYFLFLSPIQTAPQALTDPGVQSHNFLSSYPQRARQPPTSSLRVERHRIRIPNLTRHLYPKTPKSSHHTPASRPPNFPLLAIKLTVQPLALAHHLSRVPSRRLYTHSRIRLLHAHP